MRQCSMSTATGGTCKSEPSGTVRGKAYAKHEDRIRADWTTAVCIGKEIRMLRIYLSGPITGHEDYKEHFSRVEEKLLDNFNGVEVINPARILDELPDSTSWRECMRICYKLLDMSDAICMLSGWDKSKGACIEYGYAYAKDLILMKEEIEHGTEQRSTVLQ